MFKRSEEKRGQCRLDEFFPRGCRTAIYTQHTSKPQFSCWSVAVLQAASSKQQVGSLASLDEAKCDTLYRVLLANVTNVSRVLPLK